MGDTVLALFGIPTAHEDDPRRAVRATLDLHEFVRGISPDVEKKIGAPLRMHSGINTGLIVTHLRDDREGKYGITGDTVTVGAQLATRAKADEILLSAESYNLAAPYFNTSPLKPIKIKGKSQAQEVYRVEGESRVETRFEAAEERGFTPFKGRERELETLRNNLDRATAGEGRFVTVAGEAGVGKSRLLYEFHHSLDRDRVMVLEGRCQSYGSETPYLPFINALQRGLRLLEGDTPAKMLEKSVTNILAIDKALEKYLPLYLHLQSIQSKDYPLPKRLQGPEFASATQEALSAIFTLASLKQPMVVVFEDWHWADGASQAALNHLLGVLASHPLMVVVLYRQDFSPPWGSPGHHTSIALNPMESKHSEEIVAAALQTSALPEGLARLIHERTGGNPFFIEEVCGALVDEGTLTLEKGQAELMRPLENINLPDTVQAVIQTRLDRLDPQVRETLGMASVIGREFTRGILAKVLSDPARLSVILEELKALEMIQQTSVVPEAAYRFNHVLTQEVTYNSLLLKTRRELHRKVGLAIEGLYVDRIEEKSELLAHHFSASEDWEKAVKFGRMAAEKVQSLSQYQQAIYNYERAISWLNEIPEDYSRQLIIAELYWQIGNNSTNLGELVNAEKAFQSAQNAASSLNEPYLLGKIQIALANAYGYMGKFSTANKLFQQGLEQIEVSKDEYSIAWAKHTLGTSYLGPGYWEKAESLISEALRTYEKLGRLIEYSFNYNYGTVGYAHAGYCLAAMGKVERALEYFELGGSPELQESSNLMTRMVYITWLGLAAGLIGDNPVEAIERADQIVRVAEKSDSPFQMLGALAAHSNILMGMEDFAGVKVSCDRALEAIEGKYIRTGHVGNIRYNLVYRPINNFR